MGISYINADGEGEGYASELCRIGYVDYVLSEDMDTLVYGCPKLIRNCLDKTIKRKDIISIIDYEKTVEGLKLTHDEFIEFCILCGCDYCESVSKIGNITAYKLIKKYKTIENIMNQTNYLFPENYLETFQKSKVNFNIFYNTIDINNINIYKSEVNIESLKKYLINDINMNETRVQNTLKKFYNNYK